MERQRECDRINKKSGLQNTTERTSDLLDERETSEKYTKTTAQPRLHNRGGKERNTRRNRREERKNSRNRRDKITNEIGFKNGGQDRQRQRNTKQEQVEK